MTAHELLGPPAFTLLWVGSLLVSEPWRVTGPQIGVAVGVAVAVAAAVEVAVAVAVAVAVGVGVGLGAEVATTTYPESLGMPLVKTVTKAGPGGKLFTGVEVKEVSDQPAVGSTGKGDLVVIDTVQLDYGIIGR